MARVKLPYVSEYRDRHGMLRRYYRRKGHRRVALPGPPGSPQFLATYQEALSGQPTLAPSNHGVGSFAALATEFFRSVEFANLARSSQQLYRITLSPLLQAHGHRLVRDMTVKAARKIVEDIGSTRPAMANLTRSVLRRLLQFAVKTEWRDDNPVAQVARYKLGAHHTWGEEEIAAYEKRWPLGTRERLAFALLLYTGQRVGDVANMRRADISNGMIRCRQRKTGAELLITIHPTLDRIIKAGPSHGMYLVGDKVGRPMTRGALSSLVARAGRAAGLDRRCVTHGIRKSAMRRLAEHGSSSKEIQSVSGHRSLKEIERYTEAADQARLNKAAIARLPDGGLDKRGTPSD
jgi:integrase